MSVCYGSGEANRPGEEPAGPLDIVSVTDSSGDALFETGTAHSLSEDDLIYIDTGDAFTIYQSGLDPLTILATPSATTFTAENTAYGGDATGTYVVLDAAFTSVTDVGGGQIRLDCTFDVSGILSASDEVAIYGGLYDGLTLTVVSVPDNRFFVTATYLGDSSGGVKKVVEP